MSSIEVNRPRTIIVAIALAALALAYLDAQGRVTAGNAAAAGPDTSLERSDRATEVEAAVARTNLVANMAAALGDDFGGVWFDPPTAQVHVGITSPASRSNAEAVAAQAGLSGSVTATPVASTVAELEAAQERWGDSVSDLFARAEVGTWLSLRDNAVAVELGSSVPPSRRQELEQAAARDPVNVSIRISSHPSLRVVKAAQCAQFTGQFKAYCDPTIVAGVRIENEAGGSCSAGPPAILKKRPTVAKATATYLLTAGHCIEGGGAGKKWFAINKKGLPEGKKELGKGGTFINGAIDVGVIETNTTFWVEAKDPPLVPKVAQWSAAAEHEPTTIKAEAEPMEKGKTCFSGQRSGKVCGKIEGTNVKFLFEGEPVETEKLVKVKLTGKGGKGDSGSPFYSEALPSSIEGTFVGFEFEEGNKEESSIVFFHSLKTGFASLEAQKGLSLELLKESNHKRHKKIKAGKYPVTIHGSSAATHKFTTEAGTAECKESTYHAVLSEASSTLTLTPVYKNCTALGFAATVEMEGCTYVFHAVEKSSTDNYVASTDVSCPEGKSIKFAAGTCKWEVKAQSDLEAVDLIDDTAATPKKDVTLRPTVVAMAYTVTQDGIGCPFSGVGAKTGGEYTSTENVTLTGQSTTEPAEKIDIEVADE